MIRVALDVLGGDAAPEAPLEGALAALARWPDELSIALVGPEALLAPRMSAFPSDRVELIEADQRIEPSEAPVLAVRRKPGSTIVRGLEAVRDGRADAFISAGSTGAVMAASVLTLGVLPGVDRPPVGALVPTERGRVLVLDVGANIHVRPHQLHQFAHLGSIYVRASLGKRRPRIGLLNVGEEERKGDESAVAAYALLSDDPAIDFVGNVEGHQIIAGAVDVLVCGGFVGNVLLKFYESMAGFILGILRGSGVADVADVADLDRMLRFLDYAEVGGAPLLGVDGVVVICHGSSPPRAIENALRAAIDSVTSGMVAEMRSALRGLRPAGAREGAES